MNKPKYQKGTFLIKRNINKRFKVISITESFDDECNSASFLYNLKSDDYKPKTLKVWEHELYDLSFEIDKEKTKMIKGLNETLGKFFSI